MTRMKGFLILPTLPMQRGVAMKRANEESDKDDLIEDIEIDFNSMEQTGVPLGSNLAQLNKW